MSNVFNPTSKNAAVASLAHGLAHEVGALTEAKRQILLNGACAIGSAVETVLDRMIDDRKQRVQMLGAQVNGHA